MVKVDEINMMQQMHDEKKGLGELIKALDKDGDEELTQKELFGSSAGKLKDGDRYKPDQTAPKDAQGCFFDFPAFGSVWCVFPSCSDEDAG